MERIQPTRISVERARRKLTAASIVALALPVMAHAQAGGPPPDLDAVMRQAMEAAARSQQSAPPERPPIVNLRESDVTGVIGAIRELKLLDPDGKGLGDSPEEFSRAVAADSRVQEILTRNGLTADRMPAVVYSISMALASLETSKADLDKARASRDEALEQMKSRLTPEQYAMMKQQVGAFDQGIQQLETQPSGNVALVQKYRAQLEAALD